MEKSLLLLIIQTLICNSLSEKLLSNNDFGNPKVRIFDQLNNINNFNETITSGIVEYARVVSPESLIEIDRTRNSFEKIETNASDKVNDSCTAQFSSYVNGLSKFELWALKMLDSSSKIPSGIFVGNTKDLGQYDECIAIKELKQDVGLIRGRHCMYSLFLTSPNISISISQQLSICVPASCGGDDIKERLQNAINLVADQLPVIIGIGNVHCSEVDPAPYDTGEIVTIAVFSLLLCFLIGCTLYDIFIRASARSVTNSILTKLCEFSFYTSLVKIFNTSSPKGSISVIEGIRFFSLCWVILGHEYIIKLFGAIMNIVDLMEWTKSWSGTVMFIAPFAVDTFFVLSGFLTSYLFMKEMSKGRTFNIFLYYLHRYIRLTPALAAVVLISIYMAPRWGSGALWQSTMIGHSEECKESWWRILLYVQNYVMGDELSGCLGHTWYLAVDMNLFWISPLIIYPLAKTPKIGLAILTGFIVASIIIPAVIVAENEYPSTIGADMKNPTKTQGMMKDLYMASHARAGAWLLGVLLGYILFLKPNPKMRLITIGWALAILAFAFSLFTYRVFQSETYEWNAPWEVFYAAVSRHIWAFGICWLIYSSVVGYGGIVSRILSWPIYLPFTRISYSVYLVSLLHQMMKTSAGRAPFYFSDGSVIYSFFAELIVCIIGGLALSLVFESPFLALERMILGRPKRNEDERQENNRGISNGGYVEKNGDVDAIVENAHV